VHIVGGVKTLAGLLVTYWLDIVIVVAGLAAAILLWRRGKVDFIKRLIRTLVVEAEKEYGSGTGRIKFEAVLTAVYERLPAILRLVISKQRIEQWIEEAVQWLKDQLGDGTNLLDLTTEVTLAANPTATVGNLSSPSA
jgi:hypothetical protein